MKILHIADQPPGNLSGGQLGILQFSYSLTHFGAEVDYVGPKIDSDEIAGWYKKVDYLNDKLGIIQKINSILHFQFDRKYISWKKRKFDYNEYDLIYIDFTKMDYVLKDIRKKRFAGRVVVRAHNVEADFFRLNFAHNKGVQTFAKYIVAKPRERYMVHAADCVLAITKEDKERLIELYNVAQDRIKICPVGVNLPIQKRCVNRCFAGEKMKCLITGTLNFGPNVEATTWFLSNVFAQVNDIIDLRIAGFRPNDKLKILCKEIGINLVDSPDKMEPFFMEADMVLAPIFDGGGMKVKVAEAMSYGLPVVTTDHGNIGYDLVDHENGFIANTPDEYAKAIRDYYEMSEDMRDEFLNRVWDTYCEKFSLTAVKVFCEKTFRELIGK